MLEHKRGKEVTYDTNKRENKEEKEKTVRRGRDGHRKRVKQEEVVVAECFPPVQ